MSKEQFAGFDDDLKDLKPEVKEKALKLASGYLKDGIEAAPALKRAITEAEAWFLDLEG
ncbi:hypothetical protein [Mucilaginibacter sp. L3T2-6]|uniref:hypothetical protein n=1 Tax=Mucilaginibacter sp. L3T2-6 TaxID=3062491 RepID=UPI002674FB29|nr:hypothetical protein [Mucilaginibacter sp. L3T2-6]MDO3641491.1 hypothetical protein [Mucilaginibacter sp. L3T2-6]MDV6213748.1 hypothetical protein [Mucilaginibacter sp. L3T2-6]